jgi:DNA-binding NarL/FixJ family response regulator
MTASTCALAAMYPLEDSMIDVIVIDDNPVVRAALRGYLDSTDEARVVGEAGDGIGALQLAQRVRPQVILLDYRMPIADGLSVVTALASYGRVLVLTSDESDELVTRMLQGGAQGYLVHGQFDPDELLRAVRSVAAGQSWLSPEAARAAVAALRTAGPSGGTGLVDELTDREHDVLNLLSLGLSNAAIAKRLWLSEKTVKNHLHRAFAKLGVGSRSEAMVAWNRVRR